MYLGGIFMNYEEMSIQERAQELLRNKQFVKLKEHLNNMNPADIAQFLSELGNDELIIAFRITPKDLAADTFVEMDAEQQEQLIHSFTDKELKEVVDELYLDDAVDIVEEMPANVVKRILRAADTDMRKMINTLLKYPDDSAGSIMTIEYVSLRKSMTVNEAIKHIRKTGVDKETIYTCYVTDNNSKLIGIVSVKSLLLANESDIIENIMESNPIFVSTLEDKEVVANDFDKYNFIALPVVDEEQRLVGIVTFDDAIDVLQDEATEDIEKMAAILPTDKPYMRTGIFETFRKRIPWLLLLMVSATFTGMIINSFENALKAHVVLTAFIPMLMDTAGNSGSQASVTIIRGLSLSEIEYKDTLRVVWKEMRVAFLCGIVLALANFVKCLFVDSAGLAISAVVSVTLVSTVFFAKIIGCLLPIAAKRVGFDPAVMASPFITTIVDALSLLVYFKIASACLPI